MFKHAVKLTFFPFFTLVSAEVFKIQCGWSNLAVQAANPVYSQPEPEGCIKLWPIPAGIQRQGWQVSGWGETAKGIPLPIYCSCTLPWGRCGSCAFIRLPLMYDRKRERSCICNSTIHNRVYIFKKIFDSVKNQFTLEMLLYSSYILLYFIYCPNNYLCMI